MPVGDEPPTVRAVAAGPNFIRIGLLDREVRRVTYDHTQHPRGGAAGRSMEHWTVETVQCFWEPAVRPTPVLIHYMLIRLCIGFALGAMSAFVILHFNPTALGATPNAFESLLFAYGVGTSFAMGYLATALGFEGTEQ